MTQTLIIRHTECVPYMQELPEDSIGAIVCDPPYGISFLGREWDNLNQQGVALRNQIGSQQVWHRMWLREAIRVLRPGGLIKAFGATRTFHWLAAAMEEVGFQDIHLDAWIYSSGFPKNHDVAKSLDKLAGVESDIVGVRYVKGGGTEQFNRANASKGYRPSDYQKGTNRIVTTKPSSELAKKFDGYGTALKPAWEPILIARKP